MRQPRLGVKTAARVFTLMHSPLITRPRPNSPFPPTAPLANSLDTPSHSRSLILFTYRLIIRSPSGSWPLSLDMRMVMRSLCLRAAPWEPSLWEFRCSNSPFLSLSLSLPPHLGRHSDCSSCPSRRLKRRVCHIIWALDEGLGLANGIVQGEEEEAEFPSSSLGLAAGSVQGFVYDAFCA
jgi:hypothetical protein